MTKVAKIKWQDICETEQVDVVDSFHDSVQSGILDELMNAIKDTTKGMRVDELYAVQYISVDLDYRNGSARIRVAAIPTTDCLFDAFRLAKEEGDLCSMNSVYKITKYVTSQPKSDLPVVYCVRQEYDSMWPAKFLPFDKRIPDYPYSQGMFSLPRQVLEEATIRESNKDKKQKSSERKEIQLEYELYDWLRAIGVDAERKVKTSSGHEIDLWIPGVAMIELKRDGKSVSANDVCQCIDYASEYSLPILLVGTKITTAASRGLSGFSKFAKDKIHYIPTNTIKLYLRSFLSE